MKNIILRKHKSYSEQHKVYILNFSKKIKNLLQNSNIFVKGIAIPVSKNLIIKQRKQNIKFEINNENNPWLENIYFEIIKIKKQLQETNKDLLNQINKTQIYWMNLGYYENNKFFPIQKEYLDFNNVIEDMNKSFQKFKF